MALRQLRRPALGHPPQNISSMSNPPKVHLPGKGAPSPQLVRVAARSSRAGSGATSRCGRDGSPRSGLTSAPTRDVIATGRLN